MKIVTIEITDVGKVPPGSGVAEEFVNRSTHSEKLLKKVIAFVFLAIGVLFIVQNWH